MHASNNGERTSAVVELEVEHLADLDNAVLVAAPLGLSTAAIWRQIA